MNFSLIIACLFMPAPQDHPVRVGIAHFPPMINIDSKTGEITGSDYDMFELLVDDPDIAWNKDDYEYVVVNSFGNMMSQLEQGQLDIAIDGISITHDRLRKMHFSQPYTNSGLRIMTPPRKEVTTVWSYLSRFLRLEILFSLLAFVANCLFWGAVVYVVERFFSRPKSASYDAILENKVPDDTPNIKTFEQGSLAAFDAGTTIGYGRYYPVTRLGQFVIVAAFFCGAIVVGDVISTLTTNKIVHRLEGEINSPSDLKGKMVAVVDGTTSEQVVSEYNPAQIIECDDFYKAVVEMRLGNAEAVVADDPVIRNYVKNNPNHGALAGTKFHPEDYGIAFNIETNPDLVKQFSIAIARMRESGKLGIIENQWFGE